MSNTIKITKTQRGAFFMWHEKRTPVVFFLLALGVRLALCFYSDNTADGIGYLLKAEAWLHEPYLIRSSTIPPLRILFPAFWLMVWGDLITWPRIVTALFGALTVFPLYGLIKIFARNKKEIVFGTLILFAFYPSHVKWSVITSAEVPFIFFVVTALYFFQKALFSVSRGNLIALFSGIFSLIAAMMFHFDIWLILPLCALAILRKYPLRIAAIALLLLGLFPALWMIGNFLDYGDPLYFLHLSDDCTRAQMRDGLGNPWSDVAPFYMDSMHRIFAWPYRLTKTLTPLIGVLGFMGAVISLCQRRRCVLTGAFWMLFIPFFIKTLGETLVPLERYSIILGVLLIPHATLFLSRTLDVFTKKSRHTILVLCCALISVLYVHKVVMQRPLSEPVMKNMSSWFREHIPSGKKVYLQEPVFYQQTLTLRTWPSRYRFFGYWPDPFKTRQQNFEITEQQEEKIFINEKPDYAVLTKKDEMYEYSLYPDETRYVEKYGTLFKRLYLSPQRKYMIVERVPAHLSGIPFNLLASHFIEQESRENSLSAFSSKTWSHRRRALINRLKTILAMDRFNRNEPLNAVVVDRIRKEDYTIEKVVFESMPQVYVTALVYVPNTITEPVPAVLNLHGHWYDFALNVNGKALPVVQKRCIALAKKGYIAMAIDDVGYGERSSMGHDYARDAGWSPATRLLLTGQPLMGIQIWDSIRAIDYLYSRPDVERTKIGVTGSSGGGVKALLTTLMDERISSLVAVHADHFLYNHTSQGCICETLPGLFTAGDPSELFLCVAPRPFLYITQHPLEEVIESNFNAVYDFYGSPEYFKCEVTENRYGYDKPIREMMYAWFAHHLKGLPFQKSSPEPVVQPCNPQLLRCMTSPQGDYHGKTLTDIARDSIKSNTPRYTAIDTLTAALGWQQEQREKVLIKLNIDHSGDSVRDSTIVLNDDATYLSEYISISRQGEDLIQGIYLTSKSEHKKACIIYLAEKKEFVSMREELFKKLVQDGYDVFAVFLPESFLSKKNERALTLRLLERGTPLFGKRVESVMGAVDYVMKMHVDAPLSVYLFGEGGGGIVGLFAAALDDRIQEVVMLSSPVSYMAGDDFKWPIALSVYGLLRDSDIPDIAALIAPRRLMIIDGRDGVRKSISPTELESYFKNTKYLYTMLKAGDRLILQQKADDTLLYALLTSKEPHGVD